MELKKEIGCVLLHNSFSITFLFSLSSLGRRIRRTAQAAAGTLLGEQLLSPAGGLGLVLCYSKIDAEENFT